MKIDDATRAELALLLFKDDTATIANQLDRKAYKLVNDVLVACGGKWNRTRKTHVFEGDAEEALDPVITTGVVLMAADMQFFPTNPTEAESLVQWVLGDDKGEHLHILEPSAGDGAIARFAAQRGPTVMVEVDPKHEKVLQQIATESPYQHSQEIIANFMHMKLDDMPNGKRFTHIVGNPPFAKTLGCDAIDHFRHSFSLLASCGTMGKIMPESIKWRGDKRHTMFRDWLEGLDAEIEPLPDGAFKHAKTLVKTVRVKVRAT